MRTRAVGATIRLGGRPVLLGLALLGLVACEETAERKVRLTITSQAQIPSQLDRVVVRVAAARRDNPAEPTSFRVCEPAVGEFNLAASGDLPIYIDYFPGLTYNYWVAFRVECWCGSVLRRTDEWMASLGESGADERTVTLDAACASMPVPCAAGLKCVEQNCVDPGGEGPFDHPELIDLGISCSPLGGPPDGGP
jgi:hypothetical protein